MFHITSFASCCCINFWTISLVLDTTFLVFFPYNFQTEYSPSCIMLDSLHVIWMYSCNLLTRQIKTFLKSAMFVFLLAQMWIKQQILCSIPSLKKQSLALTLACGRLHCLNLKLRSDYAIWICLGVDDIEATNSCMEGKNSHTLSDTSLTHCKSYLRMCYPSLVLLTSLVILSTLRCLGPQ